MNITLKHSGQYKSKASIIIDLEIRINESTTISYEITDKLDSTIGEDVLKMFKSIVSELEQQNELIKNS